MLMRSRQQNSTQKKKCFCTLVRMCVHADVGERIPGTDGTFSLRYVGLCVGLRVA